MTEAAKDTAAARAPASPSIADVLRAFVDGFNTNSLDEVMTFFADDAVYEPERGKIVGKFSYANYGKRPHVRRGLGLTR